jgi:hypothetical protein
MNDKPAPEFAFVAAQPGYKVLSLDDGQPHDMYRMDVIGWRLSPSLVYGQPICTEPFNLNACALQYPDGRVVAYEKDGEPRDYYANEDVWAQFVLEKLQNKQRS